MGDNLFVSFVERVARVAQYARNNYSMWWNGKEYPWDKKRGKFMRWSGGNNPHPEEPGYEDAYLESTDAQLVGGGGEEPNLRSNNEAKTPPRKKSDYEKLYPLFGDPSEPPEELTDKNKDGSAELSNSNTKEKPLPPMASNHPTSQKKQDLFEVKTAEDFSKVVDIVLSQTLPPEAAEYEKNKTKQFIVGMREYIENRNKYNDLFEQWGVLNRQITAIKGTHRENNDPYYFELVSKAIDIRSRADDIKKQNEPFQQKIASRVQNLSEKERRQNLAFLKKAFPNRGGTSFFEDSFKAEVLENFRKLGIEKDAQYVFEFYDILGKSFNTKRKKAKPPTMVFKEKVLSRIKNRRNNSEILVASRYDRYGLYGSRTPIINMSIDPRFRGLLKSRLALNLGRWLEQRVVGGDQMKDNLAWLQRKTGDKTLPNYGEVHKIPQKKAPFLCVSPDGLAMTIEGPLEYLGEKGRNKTTHPTEVFSTGMQWLAIYPEMFAKQSPKHFTQVLKNLRMIGANGKR